MRNELGLHRRRSHHQTADDGHRLTDGLGQVNACLLQELKGHQQAQHLQHRWERHRLFALNHGPQKGQRNHFLVKSRHGHIKRR